MALPRSKDGEARFSAYVEGLTSVIGHADRAKPLRDYCLGLMMPCERKSVEPMAAITAPKRTAAQHQSLLHLSAREDGRTRRFSRRCGNWCCRCWNATGHRSVVFRTEPATNQNFTRYFEVICWPTIGLRAASDGAAEVITALAGRRTHSKTRVPRAQNAFTRGADDL